jgi:hypothetical protein
MGGDAKRAAGTDHHVVVPKVIRDRAESAPIPGCAE